MNKTKLSPVAKQIRQTVMNRLTRAIHGEDRAVFDAMFKSLVHGVLTDVLLELEKKD